jgi:ferredoxin
MSASDVLPEGPRLTIDWTRCTAHRLCVEVAPELIGVDDWGYPVLPDRSVPPALLRRAEQAFRACPVSALALGQRESG